MRYLTQCYTAKLVKNSFAVKDIKEARQRLDRLVQEEVATTAAQILGGVDRPVHVQEEVETTAAQILEGVDRLDRRLLLGGKRPSAWLGLRQLNHPFLSRWRSTS